MKKAKRLLCVLLTMAMVLAFTLPAMAAEGGDEGPATGSDVRNVTNETDHHYYAYQIFSGTQSGNDYALASVEWGSGINDGVELLRTLQSDSRFVVDGKNIFAGCKSAEDVAKALGEYDNDSSIAKAFANVVSYTYRQNGNTITFLTDERTTIPAGATNVTLAPGYYLLVDAGVGEPNEKGEYPAPGKEDAYNSALLQVTNSGSITIAEKYSVPEVDKDIIENGEHVEATDATIGDIIEFEIVGTLPSNYDDFEFYRYIFRDTMSHGLELVGDYEITGDGYQATLIKEGVTVKIINGSEEVDITPYNDRYGMKILIAVAWDNNNPKENITIQFGDLKEFAEKTGVEINKDSQFVISYKAKLTQFATTGNGNDREQSNRVFLEYYRNPNDSSDPNHVNRTPEDVVLIFTYELDVTKIDSETENKPDPTKLADAQFRLYREENGQRMYLQLGAGPDEVYDHFPVDNVKDIEYKVRGWTENEADATVLTSEKDRPFRIIGLDKGTYYLEEIKAPDGYNKLEQPVEITIEAKVDTDEDHPGPGKILKITTKRAASDKEGASEESTSDGTISTGTVEMQISNKRGVILPSTGGIGTTLFYAAGAVMALGAGGAIFKRRKKA